MIADEMGTLIEEGRWTRAEFDRLRRNAIKAAAGNESYCEFLLNQALPEWL